MKRLIFCLAAMLLLAMNGGRMEGRVSAAMPKLLLSFESNEVGNITVDHARVSLSSEHVTEGKSSLQIEFEPATRPGVTLQAGNPVWDCRGFGAVAFDVTNPSDDPLGLSVRLSDGRTAAGGKPGPSGHAPLAPHASLSFAVPLPSAAPMAHGMRGAPPFPGVAPITYFSDGALDEGHVVSMEIALDRISSPHTLFLDNVRLLPPAGYDGILDAFGEYTGEDWPGKLKDAAEFQSRRTGEESAIAAAPSPAGRDEYGGWASGPQLPAPGFFRTTQREGKWWLVTPSGHLFFSLGVDVISLGDGFTVVEGREKMFNWLPAESDPLARHYGRADDILLGPIKKGRTFNFYSANLERKYGADYVTKWRAAALDRLRAWGFNTIGNWSDPELYALKRVPYVVTVDISGDYARVASGADYWGKMHDPFDPRFAAAVERSVREPARKYQRDPWCLGYFIDNEISWGGGADDRSHFGLVYGTLASPPDQPAKKALLEDLKKHYAAISELNKAWQTHFASWEEFLQQPYHAPATLPPGMKKDFSDFLRTFARQYFRVVRDALGRYDSNHLYLGCRFAWRTPEAVEAAAEFVDVVSFNIYRPLVDPREWDFVQALNKPCIIGEFHSGAVDRGMFHTGLVAAANQADRARMYQNYILSVVDNPAFVGCHWFQYFDEPVTGRSYDGENYNIGLADVTDTPYQEMIAGARAVHEEVYPRRAAK